MATLPAWWDRVDGIMRAAGVSTRVWTAIAFPESGFVPWAANTADPNGGSYGLFALNLGGQGHGYSVAYLKDPINNAQISAPHLAAAVRKCGADDIQCIALWSGHPVETGTVALPNALITNIKRYFGAGKDLTGPQIYDKFTSGQGIPAVDPGSGEGGESGGTWWDGLVAWYQSIQWVPGGIPLDPTVPDGGVGQAQDLSTNIMMLLLGIFLIIVGVIIAAAKSPVGQAAASFAPAPVQIGSRVARAL